MSFDIFIKLNGDLSDILYQTSAAFIVACKTQKRLTVSVDNINTDYVPLLKSIKQYHSVNCKNGFYDTNVLSDDLCAYIPKSKKNMEMFGSFKNKNYSKHYKDLLITLYNLESEKDYNNSMYIYIDNSYVNNKEKYLGLINEKKDTDLYIIIDSDKYDIIKMELLEVHKEVTIVENNDYKKLCVMTKCGKGGYYTGETLGWWGSFLNINDCINLDTIEIKILRNDEAIFVNEESKKNIDVSIVMAYGNHRKQQTINTLMGFEKNYMNKYNFEVVIVDDNSLIENRLEEEIKKYSFPINLILITPEEKGDIINPCIAYNRGLKEAKGEIIIIQNPEVYHIDNILLDTINNICSNTIISYSCYGLKSIEQNNLIHSPAILKNKINHMNIIGGSDKTKDDLSIEGWLNHKTVNPTYYHYCLSILKKDLNILGLFSIDFRKGFCYDDDEFVRRAYYKNFNIYISDLLVIHQFHESTILSSNLKKKLHYINFQVMMEKSKMMNISLNKQFKVIENKLNQSSIPKIAFTFWSGKNFTYLHLLSIETFCFYNPSYKFIIYTDMNLNTTVTELNEFTTSEQSLDIKSINYFNKINDLKKFYNIEIILIDKLLQKKCIIINADYYRMYFLIKHGGIWVDLDILHLKPIDNAISTKKDLFIHKYEYSDVITTGIIGSIKNHPKFQIIFEEMNSIINENTQLYDYQAIGPSIFTKYKYLFTDNEYIEPTSFYPIEWYDIQEYYKDNMFDYDFYGIHWYNGSNYTRKFINEFEKIFNNKHLIEDKYCFINKLIKKFYLDKINKFSTNYINFKFIPYSIFVNKHLFTKIFFDKISLDQLAIICEKNINYYAFDTYGYVYIKNKCIEDAKYNEFMEFIDINSNINGIYIKSDFITKPYSEELKVVNGCYFLNNINLNEINEKILYVTHEEEFKKGYGQLFRKDRLTSLQNDDRFDCADITENYYDNKCFYNKHKALITTHDCVRIETKHPGDNSIHWCSHSLCGHNKDKDCQEWSFNNFKNYMNLLSLKTKEISHRLIILEDMHYYTFRGSENNYNNGGIENLCTYIDKYYNFVIYHYENFELEEIKKKCKNVIKFYALPHHVNTDIYKKYTDKKEYDILFYGSCDKLYYPLRNKIKNALLSSNLNYVILEKPTSWHELNNNVLDKLSQKINKSYITISCTTKTNYAVCKYFEIAASNSVVAGDSCPIIDNIFGENMIKLNISMSDEDIINTLSYNLENKKKLLEMSNNMYNKIHNEYALKNYNQKLVDIVKDSLKYTVKPVNVMYNQKNIQDVVHGFHYVYLFPPNLNNKFTIKNNTYFFSLLNDNNLCLFKENNIIKNFIIVDEIKIIKVLQGPDDNMYVYINTKLQIHN
jgi:hypothetical protein